MENIKTTIIIYTYRYIFKTKNGQLNIKYLTEPQSGHAKFQQAVRDDENVVSCIREYVSEINFEYFGFTEPVKEEKNDVLEEEEKEN